MAFGLLKPQLLLVSISIFLVALIASPAYSFHQLLSTIGVTVGSPLPAELAENGSLLGSEAPSSSVTAKKVVPPTKKLVPSTPEVRGTSATNLVTPVSIAVTTAISTIRPSNTIIPTPSLMVTPYLGTPTVAVPSLPTVAVSPISAPVSSQSVLININTAGLAELDKIPTVGPATAQNIIDYRVIHGPFKRIEDIKNVNRIGDKTFEKMKSVITVGE